MKKMIKKILIILAVQLSILTYGKSSNYPLPNEKLARENSEQIFKAKVLKIDSIFDINGCPIVQFLVHIEEQFKGSCIDKYKKRTLLYYSEGEHDIIFTKDSTYLIYSYEIPFGSRFLKVSQHSRTRLYSKVSTDELRKLRGEKNIEDKTANEYMINYDRDIRLLEKQVINLTRKNVILTYSIIFLILLFLSFLIYTGKRLFSKNKKI